MKDSVKVYVLNRIRRGSADVFLRADFEDLGSYGQVGRVLLQLVNEGKLIKMGYGIYVRARPSVLDGSPTPAGDLRTLADKALRRLGIKTSWTTLERDYDSGRTTQLPSGRRIGVDRRVRRKIGFNGIEVSFERAQPPVRSPAPK